MKNLLTISEVILVISIICSMLHAYNVSPFGSNAVHIISMALWALSLVAIVVIYVIKIVNKRKQR